MAALIDNWLQPIIDIHLPALHDLASSLSLSSPASTFAGAWAPSSPNSQPKYQAQSLIQPLRGTLRLRLRFHEGASESLQLVTYFNRAQRNECQLSDGRFAIKAQFSKLCTSALLEDENIRLSDLSVGAIVQIEQLSISFHVKTRGSEGHVIVPRLVVECCRVISSSQSRYGHPKPIETLAVFGEVSARALPESLIIGSSSNPSQPVAISHVSNEALPTNINHKSDKSTPARPRELSEELGDDPTPPSSRQQTHILAIPETPKKNNHMATAVSRGHSPLKAQTFANPLTYRRWPPISRRLCAVPKDQNDILQSGSAWIPPEEGSFTSAPLPPRVKNGLHKAKLAAERSVNSQTQIQSVSREEDTTRRGADEFTSPQVAQHRRSGHASAGAIASFHNNDTSHGSDKPDGDGGTPISSWSDSQSPPPPQRAKTMTGPPPDSPELASSMIAPSSPPPVETVPTSPSITYEKTLLRPQIEQSIHRSDVTRLSSRSRSSSMQPPPLARPRQSLPARPEALSRSSTPLVEWTQSYRRPVANPEEWVASKWAPSSSRVVSTHRQSLPVASDSRDWYNAREKRKAEEQPPASTKRRNLGIAFGFSQDPKVTYNPNRQTNNLKREFIGSHLRQETPKAAPPSSRVPETQVVQRVRDASVDTKVPSSAATSPVLPRNSLVPSPKLSLPPEPVSTGLPILTDMNADQDAYATFKQAYPTFDGAKVQFTKLCKQLSAVQATFPKLLWDDFIMRHKTDYQPYVAQCMEDTEVPKTYVEFCSDFEIKCPKRVMTAALLKRALDSPS